MRALRWIYALLAALVLAWLGMQLLEGAHESPRKLLESAKVRLKAPDGDMQRALADLQYALDLATVDHDDAVVEEALLERARVLRNSGGLTQARADLERVLTYYKPGSPAIESQLAAVVFASGEIDDALERCDSILARDPTQSEAWATRASALLALAERRLDQAATRAGTSIATGGMAESKHLMRRIATLERADPSRTRLVDQLVDSFSGTEQTHVSEVLDSLDAASDYLAQLPEALAQSLRGAPRRDALQNYLRLLRDAGRNDAAINLGFAVRGFPGMRLFPPFLRELMQALIDTGRPELAAQLVDPARASDVFPDVQFLKTWCDALYRSERWGDLERIARLLRANSDGDDRAASNYYIGVALTKRKQYADAMVALTRAPRAPDKEFFPGQAALLAQTLAECQRERGLSEDERASLGQRLKIAPDRYPGVADAWLRMAELCLGDKPPRFAEGFDALGRALALAPERRAEIEPRWRELGAAMVRGGKIDIEAEYARLDALHQAVSETTTHAYMLLRLAELHLEHGNWAGVQVCAGRVLKTYPHFLPALDLCIESETNAGHYRQAADLLLERVAAAGADAATIERMSDLPLDELGNAWTLELVRLDPEATGRRLAAELLRAQGRSAEALASIEMVPAARLGDVGALVAATLAYDLGRDDAARASLASISAKPAVLARALPLALDLGARAHDASHISNLLRVLELKIDPDLPALITSADRMVLAGMPASALELCTRLDERMRWRSGALDLRMAQSEMLLGDGDAADEDLDRAAAYDESGAPELGLLLRAVQRRAWSELPRRVDELLATKFAPTPLQQAALAALDERTADARALVRAGRTREPREALWVVLDQALAALSGEELPSAELGQDPATTTSFGVGAPGTVQRDPRPLLARIVAATDPAWRAWSVADLSRDEPPAPGALWPAYVAARALEGLGYHDQAEARGRAVIAAWPLFTPAWDLVGDAIAQDVRRIDHPRVLKFAEQRRRALGPSADDRIEDLIAQAHLLEKTEHYAQAVTVITAALEIDPQRGAALRELAQLRRKMGEWPLAVDSFHRSLENAPSTSDSHPVAEFLELLDETAAASSAFREAGSAAGELDFLSKRFPRDPLVALALARREFPADARGDRARIGLIAARLAEFRARTGGAAFESLRPGSARAWYEFLSGVDVDRAYEFARDELLSQPASIDLWRMRGEASAALHAYDEAIEALKTALAMLPDAATARRLAELCVARGDDLDVVRGYVDEAVRLDSARADDPRMQLTLANALVHGTDTELNAGLQILARLWTTRDAAKRPEDIGRIGATYGTALCRRNSAADRDTARKVLEEATPRVADPTRRTLLVALAAMSRYLGMD